MKKNKSPKKPDNKELEPLKRKLIQDAKELEEIIMIEMSVNSQIEHSKKKNQELKENLRKEEETLSELQNLCDYEIKLQDQNNDEGKTKEDNQTEYIIQLEKEVRLLYEKRAQLLKQSQY